MIVEKFKIKGWKKKEIGIVISENSDWILTKSIPTDYIVDGFKIYNKNFIKKRKKLPLEDKLLTVLKLKKVKSDKPLNFEFGKVFEILNWLEKTYGLFEFQDYVEDELFYGKLNKTTGNSFQIDMIKSDGKIEIEYDYLFQADEIRTISFESDYFHSIILLMNYQIRKN